MGQRPQKAPKSRRRSILLEMTRLPTCSLASIPQYSQAIQRDGKLEAWFSTVERSNSSLLPVYYRECTDCDSHV